MGHKGLTKRQARFVSEYLVDLHGTHAAQRAGYSTNTAASMASVNLKKPKIAKAIEEGMAEREKRTKITQDKVVRELANIAFADVNDFVSIKTKRVKEKEVNVQSGESELVEKEIKYAEVTETQLLTAEQRAAVAAIKETRYGINIELYDKTGALKLLGQHLGMFNAKADTGAAEAATLAELISEAYEKRKHKV